MTSPRPGSPHTAGDTVKVTWYDGDQRPPKSVADLLEGAGLPGQGSVFIGTEGVMMLPHIARPSLFPKEKFKDFAMRRWEDRRGDRQNSD